MTGLTEDALVSVVIATNRGGAFLSEALASVAAQSHPRVEVILVDDGSPDPDALRAIVADFPGVRVLRTEPSGVSAARNHGAAHCSGDILAFLDDDDRWHPDRLQRQVSDLAGRQDAVAGYCRMRTIDTKGLEIVPGDQCAVRDVHDVIRGITGIILPNLVISRRTFEEIGGFDPAYRQGEDMDLVLKAARRGHFVFTDEVLVDYRHHEGNTTRSHRDLATGLRTILRTHLLSVREDGRDDLVADYRHRLRANDRFAAWSAARAAKGLLREGRVAAAFGEIAWALSFAPLAPVWWVLARFPRRRAMTK